MNPGLVGFSNTGVGLYAVTQNDDNDPTLPTILAFGGNVGIGVMATCSSGEGVVGQSNANGRQPPEYGGILIPGEAVAGGDRQLRRPAATRPAGANASSRQLL